ncbi:putative Disease resistance protein RPS2, partial [Corchorus capsularis]
DSLNIPSAFFERMNALRVLLLQNVIFSLDALQFLPDLRTLRLHRCKLMIKNISSLGHEKKLNKLEILQLYGTIDELPEELVELCTSLKSLNFDSYRSRCKISPNLVSRLSLLQELYVPNGGNNVNILELKSLPRLTALTLPIGTNVEYLEESFAFPKLQRYSISVNDDLDLLNLRLRSLRIRDFSYSLRAFKELFCNMEMLVLTNVEKLRSLEDLECLVDTTVTPNGFLQEMKVLRFERCRQLQWVYQVKERRYEYDETRLFPELLRSLELYSLPELWSIWKEPVVSQDATISSCLQSLKFVRISDCHKLKSIFSGCPVYSLLHLQDLRIYKCEGLEQVFDFAKEMTSSLEAPAPTVSKLKLSSLPELKCIWRPTHNVNLQSLTHMRIHKCDKLSYLFWPSLAQTLAHLEELKIETCESLEHLIKEEQRDETVSNMQQRLPLCWPKLKTLEISGCKSLKYVFPVTLAQGLPHLESAEIIDCPKLMQVFDMAKEREEEDTVLPRLLVLKLKSCPLLTRFPIRQGIPLQVHLEDVSLSASKPDNDQKKTLSSEDEQQHPSLSLSPEDGERTALSSKNEDRRRGEATLILSLNFNFNAAEDKYYFVNLNLEFECFKL